MEKVYNLICTDGSHVVSCESFSSFDKANRQMHRELTLECADAIASGWDDDDIRHAFEEKSAVIEYGDQMYDWVIKECEIR